MKLFFGGGESDGDEKKADEVKMEETKDGNEGKDMVEVKRVKRGRRTNWIPLLRFGKLLATRRTVHSRLKSERLLACNLQRPLIVQANGCLYICTCYMFGTPLSYIP